MAAKIVIAGEDFIDMEVSSYPNTILCHSSSQSSSQPREFEFQMASSINNVEDKIRSEAMLASPADELFYKGKLLPLHLPPRLQMVEKLLQNSPLPDFDHRNQTFRLHEFDHEDDELIFGTPLATTTKPTPNTTTCNTPFESCQVSRELNPEEYIFEFDDSDEKKNNNKKSWTKKLMIMKKPSIVGSTIKASRAYFRSLFGKSGGGGCSCETYYAVSTTKVADESSATSKGFNNKNSKSSGNNKKVPFGQIQRTNNKEKRTTSSTEDHGNGNNNNRHRRSFSVGLKLMQSSGNNKSSCSSSSSSFLVPTKSSSSSSRHHQNLKRCCSTNSDRENSIQGAIAHCKKSHQISTVSDDDNDNIGAATTLFSASARSVCDDQQQRPEICRANDEDDDEDNL